MGSSHRILAEVTSNPASWHIPSSQMILSRLKLSVSVRKTRRPHCTLKAVVSVRSDPSLSSPTSLWSSHASSPLPAAPAVSSTKLLLCVAVGSTSHLAESLGPESCPHRPSFSHPARSLCRPVFKIDPNSVHFRHCRSGSSRPYHQSPLPWAVKIGTEPASLILPVTPCHVLAHLRL